jgi:hypothetical protein
MVGLWWCVVDFVEFEFEDGVGVGLFSTYPVE